MKALIIIFMEFSKSKIFFKFISKYCFHTVFKTLLCKHIKDLKQILKLNYDIKNIHEKSNIHCASY